MNYFKSSWAALAVALLALTGCSRHDTSRHLSEPESANPRASLRLELESSVIESAVSPDGSTLATVTETGAVQLWDAASGRALQTLDVETPKPSRLVFSPDSMRLVGSANNGEVFLWDIAAQQLQWATTCGTSDVNAIVFSPDGKWIAASGWATAGPKNRRALIKIWESAAGKEVRENRSAFRIIGLAITSAGHVKVLENGPENKGRLWEIPFGQAPGMPRIIWQPDHGVSFTKAHFSSSQKFIASSDDIGNIWLWDTVKNRSHELRAPRASYVLSLAFSPDGKQLVNAIVPTGIIFDGKTDVQVWDVEKQTRIDSDKSHDTVRAVFFLPDNQTIGYSDAGTVRIWERER